jgi:hypothetical protein
MTVWETRGYLTYPNHYGKPRPGTKEELHWSKGWCKAQAEALENQKSDYHLSLENDALFGRDTFAASYWNENNLEF